MKQLLTILAVVTVSMMVFMPIESHALLIGGPDILNSAPGDVGDDAATNDAQQGFNEMQDVTLDRDIDVDDGSILAGTQVDSHMIFYNTEGTNTTEDYAEWVFDGKILGVMSDRGGNLEAATNDILGAEGTVYPGAFDARGMEGADWYEMIDDFTLAVNMRVSEPGDWIRVVTESPVPEPSTVLLVGFGLLGLAGLKRRFNKK